MSATVLPVFYGVTYDEHVTAWREADAERQHPWWTLAAIADSLSRSFGGRPRHKVAPRLTVIQRFCRDVRIDRQTFQRLCRTYRTFAGNSYHWCDELYRHAQFQAPRGRGPTG